MVNSSRRRRSDVGSSRSSSPVKAPQFFKIINSSVVRNRKLRIPRKFLSKYGKDLSNFIFLKVPSGGVWQVELINSNGDIWLCNGLKEFTEYYSIRSGHFLVFRYDGNSNFHVLIFDMSASEIEYPFTDGGQSKVNLNRNLLVSETEDIEIDDSVEIWEEFPTFQTTREEIPESDEVEKDVSIEILDGCPVPDFPSCGMMRTNLKSKTENTSNLQAFSPDFQSRGGGIQTNGLKFPIPNLNLDQDVRPPEIIKECNGGTSFVPRSLQFQIPDTKQSASTNGKFRALQRARAVKSEYPFFMVSMRPSYVCYKYNLNIPLDFAKKYFSRKQNNVILRVADGRTWSVKCYCDTSPGKRVLQWISFVRDNNLEVDDVCVFELIKVVEPWLNVIIFPAQ